MTDPAIESGRRAGRLARLVVVADLAGTFVFALEGALMAIRGKLDLLGIVVIAFVAALGGGILRDVLLGDAPPAAFRDQRYPLLAFAAAGLAIVLVLSGHLPPALVLTVLDAAGLALFAVAGTEKAIGHGSNIVTAAMLGMLTGVGGGATRDVLLNQVPAVLRADFYATAALAGALVVLAALRAGASPRVAALAGGIVCFALRMAGALGHWQLPRFA
jgi:uncharacterized membrane protein YeiH